MDRHVVVVFQAADFRPFLVLEVIGHLLRDAGLDRGVNPLDGLRFDLPVGRQGRILEGRPHPPAPAKGALGIADLLDRGLLLLARELQEAEFGDVGELNPRPVQTQRLLEGLFDLRVVLAVHHVDEVDDDQSPEVPQAELTGDLLRRLHVRLKCGLLDIPLVRTAPGVDVDRDHRLGGVDDQITAGLQVHAVLVDDADLILKLIPVEKRGLFLGQLDYLEISGGDGLAVGPDLTERLRIIHQNLLDVRREIVPQRADAEGALLVDQRGGGCLGGPLPDLLPETGEMLVVPGQLLLGPVHPGCPDDEADVLLGFDLLDQFLETFSVLLVLDFPGNAAALLVGQKHQISPR